MLYLFNSTDYQQPKRQKQNFRYLTKLSVLLYGSETWNVTVAVTQTLQTFVNHCLRWIQGIRWPEKISNEDLWRISYPSEIKEGKVEIDRIQPKKTLSLPSRKAPYIGAPKLGLTAKTW